MKKKIVLSLVFIFALSTGACASSKEKELAKSFHDISAYNIMVSELLENMENATFAEGKLGTFKPFQDQYSEFMSKYEAMEKDIPEELIDYYNNTKDYMEDFETAGIKLELLYQFGHSDIDLTEVKLDQIVVNNMQTELANKYGFKKTNTDK